MSQTQIMGASRNAGRVWMHHQTQIMGAPGGQVAACGVCNAGSAPGGQVGHLHVLLHGLGHCHLRDAVLIYHHYLRDAAIIQHTAMSLCIECCTELPLRHLALGHVFACGQCFAYGMCILLWARIAWHLAVGSHEKHCMAKIRVVIGLIAWPRFGPRHGGRPAPDEH